MHEEITMSYKELSRLEIIQRLERQEISRKEASQFIGVSIRQVSNLLRRYRLIGPRGLVSGHRGQSNRAHTHEFKAEILALCQEKYDGFPPTHLRDMLQSREGHKLSKETLRQWLMEAGLWTQKKGKKRKVRQLRERRSHYGEMIQIDGSPHEWFPGSPKCSLLLFVDDATSKIQLMRFYPHETTQGYLEMFRLYAERYGLPGTIYSDKHSIFRVNQGEEEGVKLTQFGRALDDIGVEHIHAHSPEAKGRVERKNRTLQERLIREMQLDGITTMAQANAAYLDEAMLRFNELYSVLPDKPEDGHVTVEVSQIHYDLMTQENRVISKQLMVSYKGKKLQILRPDEARRLHQKTVTVCEDQSGKITLLYKGEPLPYEVYREPKRYQAPQTRKEVSYPLRKPDRRRGSKSSKRRARHKSSEKVA